MLGTVVRAGQVLELFTRHQPEWGATDVARQLGIAKSRAHELLVSLASIGLLQRVPAGRYRLGWSIAMLNGALLRTTEFRAHALRTMRSISGRYGDTVHLAVCDRGRAICLGKEIGADGIQVPSGVGLPLSEDSAAAQILAAGHGDADADADLRTVAERGVAYDRGVVVADVHCVAAPIVDPDGTTVAALSVSTSAERFDARGYEYSKLVVGAARSINRQLQPASGARAHGRADVSLVGARTT